MAEPQPSTLPVHDGPCIRCKLRRPGATPFLCLICLRSICRDYCLQKPNLRFVVEEVFDVAVKRFQNNIQKRSRRAFRRIQAGLLPHTPPGF